MIGTRRTLCGTVGNVNWFDNENAGMILIVFCMADIIAASDSDNANGYE